jgi:hypothetical protein
MQITDKVVRSPGVYKWGWNEEQRACNVGLQTCPLLAARAFLSESELSSLKVRFSRCCDTGNSSLCGTDFIVDGKSGYFTVGLDANPDIFIKQK